MRFPGQAGLSLAASGRKDEVGGASTRSANPKKRKTLKAGRRKLQGQSLLWKRRRPVSVIAMQVPLRGLDQRNGTAFYFNLRPVRVESVSPGRDISCNYIVRLFL